MEIDIVGPWKTAGIPGAALEPDVGLDGSGGYGRVEVVSGEVVARVTDGIVSIPRGEYKAVDFIDGGKQVKTLKIDSRQRGKDRASKEAP